MKLNSFLLYGLSVGLNRGVMFILLPLAGYFLSLSEFGLFSLIIITSQLLIPILTLNISVVISREFMSHKRMLEEYCCYVIVFMFFLFVFFILFKTNYWYVFLYIYSEAIFTILLTRVRFYYGYNIYFLATLIKAISISLFFLTVYFSYTYLLNSMVFFFLLLIVSNLCPIFFLFFRDDFLSTLRSVNYLKCIEFIKHNKEFIFFGIILIPHGLSQWIMSSSDRYFVKIFFDSAILGQYSLAYAYASIFMLIISVLAITLPELCIRNHIAYLRHQFFSIFFIITTSLYFFVYIILYYIIFNVFEYNDSIINIFSIVYSSLYFLCFYHYCSAIHFFHKKSFLITNITILSSFISVLIAILFSWLNNILGVAFATYIAYFFYFIMISRGIDHLNFRAIFLIVLFSIIPMLLRCFHVLSSSIKIT